MDFSNSTILKAIVHEVGNKFRDEGILYSEENLDVENDDAQLLFSRYLLGSFKGTEFYNFFHSTDLEMNEVYSSVKNIFKNNEEFKEESKKISLHLYNESTHAKINKGEIYIVYFQDCRIDDELIDAVGLFKSETKEIYLKAQKKEANYLLASERGMNVDKLEKGCIIFNTDADKGYKIALVNTSRSEDAQYWKEKFLNVVPVRDNYNSTKNYLSLAKSFVTSQLTDESEVSKAEKADLLNKSVEYFKNNNHFVEEEFTSAVFQDSKVADSFKEFKESYENQGEILPKDFEIAPQVVKKQARTFKSVIKLDKNFHIYVHGKPGLIHKGFDEVSGKHFYKVFFDSET
ncbi:hypothetical protein FLA105534_04284 [Flavobacterium bizetiae]|uniref:Nucleoid-associated protein YejK n=1 Tax=Flavobacterium bizetiae TaxID=2704140 RepID=A0A6J4GVI8_9FLAO|nr:nucleoid-associated protein [Flavobacterium bizetiae]CAA9202857.1 hypothetical protein FLA105534_04284 [Flavobacterium bizetiae]CAD5343575.1 hypothetical protein FLA105535_03575 [Flavobacterium bizetiae]CAD5349570.1 hypothetical protein FLA105534_03556 [Flavobacterium bizetiae]